MVNYTLLILHIRAQVMWRREDGDEMSISGENGM